MWEQHRGGSVQFPSMLHLGKLSQDIFRRVFQGEGVENHKFWRLVLTRFSQSLSNFAFFRNYIFWKFYIKIVYEVYEEHV